MGLKYVEHGSYIDGGTFVESREERGKPWGWKIILQKYAKLIIRPFEL
jgi:hypothetical protein